MQISRLAAVVAASLIAASLVIPIHGESSNPYNILNGAEVTYAGLDAPHMRGEVLQDIVHLVDNEWAIGPRSEHGNYNAKVVDWKNTRYDINGQLTKNGDYIAVITFELFEPATAAGFRLIHPDLTGAPGVNNPLDFLMTNFDVLGSESGDVGSWKVLYEARDLRDGSDVEYVYWENEDSDGIPYWEYQRKFDSEMKVSYVALAIHKKNVEANSYGSYIHIHEFQIFAPELYTGAAMDTTPIPDNPIDITPARDPLTVQDLIPETPMGWMIVSAVLATGCAVGCMAWSHKKEKES